MKRNICKCKNYCKIWEMWDGRLFRDGTEKLDNFKNSPKLHLLISVSTLTDLFYWRGAINKFRTRAVQQQQFSKLYPFGLKMKSVAVSWSQNLPLNEPNLCQQRLKLAIIQCNMLWDPIMEDYMTMLASLGAIYIYMTNDFGQEKVVK